MKFRETSIPGVWVVAIEQLTDERGFFARAYCQREFAAHGIEEQWVQTNLAQSAHRGTIRGMHYQASPHEEAKLVRCMRGTAHCVALDLRPDSPTRGEWVAEVISSHNRRQLFVPKGVAFGYQTLADHTELFYLMSEFYVPDAARGIRHDDPAAAIEWPLPATLLSERDRNWPDMAELWLSH